MFQENRPPSSNGGEAVVAAASSKVDPTLSLDLSNDSPEALYVCEGIDGAYGKTAMRLSTGGWEVEWIGTKPSRNRIHRFVLPDLQRRFEFQRELARPVVGCRHASVMGVPKGEIRARIGPGCEAGQLVSGQYARRKDSVFVDAPRRYLTLDWEFDYSAIEPNFDPNEAPYEIGEAYFYALDFFGLDWLISDCILTLTSRYGLTERPEFRAHVDYFLDRPLTLAEQKRVAAIINAAAQSKLGNLKFKLVDEGIYTPERPIFNAPPHCVRERDSSEPPPYKEIPSLARGENAYLQRVFLLRKGQERLEVPDEVLVEKARRSTLGTGTKQARSKRTKQEFANGTGPAHYLTQLDAGKFNDCATRARMSYCSRTPRHRWSAEDVRDLTIEAAAEKGLDPNKDTDRARHFDLNEIEKDFARIEAKVMPGEAAAPRTASPAISIQEARQVLPSKLKNAMAANFPAYQHAEDLLQKPLQVTVFADPPGTGKTEALHAALPSEVLQERPVAILSETRALGDESAERHKKKLGSDNAALVNRVNGRRHLCINKKKDLEAQQFERAGMSPASVCEACPSRSQCPYVAQDFWKESGANYLQHTHAITGLHGAPDVLVFDENPLAIVLGEADRERPLSSISGPAGFAPLRRRRKKDAGRPALAASADLIANRSTLREALETARGPVSLEALSHFTRQIKNTEGEKVLYAAEARDLERSYKWQLSEKMRALSLRIGELERETDRDRAATRKEVARLKRQLMAASKEAQHAQFIARIFEAIRASAAIVGRERVDALLVSDRDGSLSVACNIRKRLPDKIAGASKIILDGTARKDLYEAMFAGLTPRHEVIVRRENVAPGAYHLTQYPDQAYSKTKWFGELGIETLTTEAGQRGERRRKSTAELKDITPERVRGMRSDANLKRVFRFILSKAYAYQAAAPSHRCRTEDGHPIDVLVVAPKAIENLLRFLELPPNVAIEHFNNLRGKDGYAQVPCVIVVGRELPPIRQLEQDAAALHYDNPAVLEIKRAELGVKRNPLAAAGFIQMADGSARKINCERHPDPDVEALRWHRSDAEVIQALHRARVFDRTADNLVELHVFGPANTGLPVHQMRRWIDAERSAAEVMAACGLIFCNAQAAMTAYPELFSGMGKRAVEKAIKGAMEGTKCELDLNRSLYLGVVRNCPRAEWCELKFRPAAATRDGRCAYAQTAYVDCARNPEPLKAMEAKLGCAVELVAESIVTPKQAEDHPAGPARRGAESFAPGDRRRGSRKTSASKSSRGRSQVRQRPSSLASGNDGEAPIPTKRAYSAK